jgi:hypothetical protein
MKNYSKHAIFAIMVAVATSLFSCTKDDGKGSGSPDSNAVAKTSVTAFIASSSATGKNVNRGSSIPVWVKEVTISANNPIATWGVSETYTMTASGGSSNFTLDNVALGINNFSANSTTNTVGELSQVAIPATGDLAAYAIKKALNPYVLYHSANVIGDNQNVAIITGGPNLVKFGMLADNGRSIAMFQWDPISPLTGYTATVESKVTKGSVVTTLPVTTISPTSSTIVYWSDAGAVTGNKIDYTIKIYSGTTLVTTLTRSYTIKNGDSNTCLYTINKDNVQDTQKNFVMVFQQLNDTNICGYDLDGYDFCSKKDNHGHESSYYHSDGKGDDGCEHNGPEGSNHNH